MNTAKKLMRSYIRHPSDIPLEYKLDSIDDSAILNLNNVSYGGVSFNSEAPINVGSIIELKILFVQPEFVSKCQVSWCQMESEYYVIGAMFLEQNDAYMARMVEQICHIEHYKNEVKRREGRDISGEQAANEWISKFASNFPKLM
ncbi:MAG: PilZ domain-containing protein [Thiohalomonadales bacterium]